MRFKELEKRMEDFYKSHNEPDPLCDCYAKKPNDCFRWDYCTQRIKCSEQTEFIEQGHAL